MPFKKINDDFVDSIMKEKLISQLIDIGVSGFEHLNGSLLKHLEGTYMLH